MRGYERSARIVRTFFQQVIGERIRTGRLRDVGWPEGLRAIVVVAVMCFGLGIALVILSTPLRQWLTGSGDALQGFTMPRSLLWVLLFLVTVSVSLWQTAIMHSVWWLRVIGTCTTASVVIGWGFQGTSFATSLAASMVTGAAITALVVLVLIRARARFAWWEFVVNLGLIALPVCLGTYAMASAATDFGFDLAPQQLIASLSFVGLVTIPAAFAAGTAVAEITTSATVWAGKLTARYALRRTAIVILVVLCLARLAQVFFEVRSLDPLRQGPDVIIASALLGLGLGVSIWAMFRYWRSRGLDVSISDLPAQMSAMAMPVGAILIAFQIPLVLLIVMTMVLTPLTGGSLPWGPDTYAALSSSAFVESFRALVGVALIGLSGWRWHRARPGHAALLLATGVMLVALTSSFLTGGRLPEVADVTVLNLTATAVTITLAVVLLLRGTITGGRAAGLSSLLVLSGLFAHRDLLDDPISALLGVSGTAFIILGLIWTLLTGSASGNVGSVKFPLPTRVMLLLANIVFATTILAMTSLIRGPNADRDTIDLKSFSDLGDLVLGTSLLVTVFVAVLMSIKGSAERFGTVERVPSLHAPLTAGHPLSHASGPPAPPAQAAAHPAIAPGPHPGPNTP